ncbi:MBL fold metallo-hydrolase [Pantoea stewartii]|uniref:MBL fold metallo-hydrolase n=1 Tax=Pantoea stewartii TaxID=66269 RepID=UPI001981FB16|nr:MBL fold metallo-hydrolase [Pantoea stewartii]
MTKICVTCGTAYSQMETTHCIICEDERQYVPASGQQWTSSEVLHAAHSNKWQQPETGLFSLQSVPDFAIGQRAFLIKGQQGNVLWDCIPNLDAATVDIIRALGGIDAIAISHPHYYSNMQDWAAIFDAPLYIHASDSEWIVRDSPHLQLWDGDVLTLLPDISLLRLGGHFAGGTVLHWAKNEGILLSGDIIQVAPGANAVSFMWSYPNMLPLPADNIRTITERLTPFAFDRLYSAFEGRDIASDAKQVVNRSAQKYIDCLQ